MNSNKPRVSIGMPVYNGENFIKEALDSILAQTYKDFELIISDNTSTDRTEEICRAYAAKDQRIRYYRSDINRGLAWNFNRVFELATAEYFKWASHDDVCAPEYVERCVEVLDREHAVVLCYSKANTIDKQGKNKGIYTENLNLRFPLPHQRLYQFLETFGWYHATQAFGLMRSDRLKKTLLMGNYPHADRVLLAELSLLGEFYEVPEYLFNRRVHPQVAQIANNTYETLAIWFDPRNRGKIILPRWRRYFEYFRAVQRTELGLQEKVSCNIQLVRRLILSPGLMTRLRGMIEDFKKVFTMPLSLLPRLLRQGRNKIT